MLMRYSLAARISVSNLHKMTEKSFSAVMTACYNKVDKSSGTSPAPSPRCWTSLALEKADLSDLKDGALAVADLLQIAPRTRKMRRWAF